METLLKKPEIKRDAEGRFEQHGKGLIKKTQKNKLKGTVSESVRSRIDNIPPEKLRGRSRKGIPNKVTANLKEAILRALDKLGGDEYLVTLGIENSSAFAGLLGKVLPAVLAMDANSTGGPAVIRFERVIVMPDGTKHVEGVTPKQLPKPVDQGGRPINYHDLPKPIVGPPAPRVLPTLQEVYEENIKIKDLDE